MKHVWLLSIPVIALLALFAVRSAPTFADPGCADACGGVVADQTMSGAPVTTYTAGHSIYAQVGGQYCTDKTGGAIFIPSGADTGNLKCGAAASSSGSSASASTASATATATKPAATSSATATATKAP